MPVVVVESPAKAKTINKYLGNDYIVKSSVGHIRDLPTSGSGKKVDPKARAAEAAKTRKLPPEKKLVHKQRKAREQLVARMGINPDKGWEANYQILPGKEKVVDELQRLAATADHVVLATDLDREGEAIAWHLREVIGGDDDRYQRVVFNEITKKAIQEAFKEPSKLDMARVNAQQTRRFLDRVVGFMVSPLLWAKVARGLSAGRVQSVAVKLIVEREREIRAFVPEEYWEVYADLKGDAGDIRMQVTKADGEKFRPTGQALCDAALARLQSASYSVARREDKPTTSRPGAPYITSTLQQAASTRMGFSVKKTMMLAQRLYEGVEVGQEGQVGLITYMRTDSPRIAPEAQAELQEYIKESFGDQYLPAKPNVYKTQKAAQEAHEAIRPTSARRDPESIKAFMEPDMYKLYKLIWNRFVASQMTPGLDLVTKVDIQADEYLFRATGTVEKFDGFRRVYVEGVDQVTSATTKESEVVSEEEIRLPALSVGERLTLAHGEEQGLLSKQHFTQPAPRYNEALLIRELEEKGIGRPSTYATIISTIQDRQYVEKDEARFKPTELGQMVNDRLVGNYPDVFDVKFTAKMESELDEIEEGGKDWIATVKDFYSPFSKNLGVAEEKMESVKGKEEPTEIICEKCGKNMVIKWGRRGYFLACPGYPECKTTKQFTKDENGAIQIVEEVAEVTDEVCDKCQSPMVVKRGRFGVFLACSQYPECKSTKPMKLGVKCPVDECEGDLVQKRTKKGRTFFSCSRYPNCNYALWDKPVKRACPNCQSPFLVEKVSKQAGSRIYCQKEGCGYEETGQS